MTKNMVLSIEWKVVLLGVARFLEMGAPSIVTIRFRRGGRGRVGLSKLVHCLRGGGRASMHR